MKNRPPIPLGQPAPQGDVAEPVRPSTRPPIRLGRFISSAGLLVLCVSFFLPQVRGCSEDVIPAKETVESSGMFLLMLGLPFLAAIVLLPLCAFRAMEPWAPSPQAQRAVAILICIVCLALASAGSALYCTMMFSLVAQGGAEAGLVAIPPGLAVLATLAGVLSVILCRLPRKAAGALFAVGVASLAYFGMWLAPMGDGIRYGLWLSAAGALLVTVGAAADWVRSRSPRTPGPPVADQSSLHRDEPGGGGRAREKGKAGPGL